MPIYKAHPLSKSTIKKITMLIRKKLKIDDGEPFPVIYFIEKYLSGLRENDYTFMVVEDKELKTSYAETDVKNKEIKVRESVYNGACLGDEKCLKILKHELGHYFLHDTLIPVFPKADEKVKLKLIEDPEWQADVFADYI